MVLAQVDSDFNDIELDEGLIELGLFECVRRVCCDIVGTAAERNFMLGLSAIRGVLVHVMAVCILGVAGMRVVFLFFFWDV